MMRAWIMAAALLAAACAPPADTPPEAPQAETPAPQTAAEATAQDACGASRYRQLVGTLASEIDQTTLPEGARIITPDTMVTQDFRPERLNIITGTDGRVSSLACY